MNYSQSKIILLQFFRAFIIAQTHARANTMRMMVRLVINLWNIEDMVTMPVDFCPVNGKNTNLMYAVLT